MILRQRSKPEALLSKNWLRYQFLLFNTNDKNNVNVEALAPFNDLGQTESIQQYIMTFNNEHNQ